MKPMLARDCQPDQVSRLLTDDNVVAQQKLDGRRLLMVDRDPYGRDGQHTQAPRHVLDALPEAGYSFDGELIGGGFQMGPDSVYWIFDLVEGTDILEMSMPWRVRWAHLHQMYSTWAPASVQLLPTAFGTAEKVDLIERVRANRGEGIIFRNAAAPYQPTIGKKRSPNLVKLKFRASIDCVIVDRCRGTNDAGAPKSNFVIAVYDHGRIREIGEVSADTGDGPVISRMLDSRQHRLGRGRRVVVEVVVTYVTPDLRAFQPVTPRLRRDKHPLSCTVGQLEPLITCKEVVVPC